MKVLVIADGLSKIKPEGDSSLAFIAEFLKKGISTFYGVSEELFWETQNLWIPACEVRAQEKGKLPQLAPLTVQSIEEFSLVLIRKDPPFDETYQKLCWLLEPYEEKIRMVNAPSVLLSHHEKMIPQQALLSGDLLVSDLIPSLITTSADRARDFVHSLASEQVVVKPFLGYQGNDVFLVGREDFLNRPDHYISMRGSWIVQPLRPEIRTSGDRRVFFFGGRYRGSFARIPKEGSIVSNLAQGGSGQVRELDPTETSVIERLEKFLKRKNIVLAGADLIGGKVNEVNVTSPTGFVTYEKLHGKNLAKEFVESLL